MATTISTFELFKLFPDQESARLYLEGRLWPNGARCPVCSKGDRITTRKGGYYRCNECQEDFTVRTGTIFERSHIPLHKWVYAMYLLVTARKGISSMQLSKEIGITQKSAWFMLHRLREACGKDLTKLQARRHQPRPERVPPPRRHQGGLGTAIQAIEHDKEERQPYNAWDGMKRAIAAIEAVRDGTFVWVEDVSSDDDDSDTEAVL